MMKSVVVAMMSLILALPAFGKTHKDTFPVPCSELWPAVKDALRNSGKYGIIGIDNTEMTASFNIGGGFAGKRVNSVVLNSQGSSCEMQTQTAFSGLAHNDAGALKTRVEESLAKLKGSKPSEPEQKPSPEAKATANQMPATIAPEAPATVAVTSNPDGADIYSDGAFVGNAPATLKISPGKHTIRVAQAGYKDWIREITVQSGSEAHLTARLEKQN